MIEIQNLVKRYKKEEVLSIGQFSLPAHAITGLVGNNGAGKTTWFKLILDLIPASEGEVLFEGQDVSVHQNWKYKVGAYLDEDFLIDYLRPSEYFDFLCRIRNLSKEDLQQHLRKFEGFIPEETINAKKYIRDLSKGNKKKIGIVSALLGSPSLVLLDEPFENLDPTSQFQLKKIIDHFYKESGVSFFISSHDLYHVAEISDRIIILEQGKIHKDMQVTDSTKKELDEYFGTLQEG